MSFHAVIIGGGIGGLTAAIALRRVGLDCTVYERAPELREVGAGISLWTNATRVLSRLGVGEAVEAVATPLRQSEIRTWDGRLLSEMDLGTLQTEFGHPTVGVHRADLQTALADHFGRDRIVLGAACVGFRQDATGVTARFADGREVRGDVLIGADGIKSVVRGQLFGPEKPRYAGCVAWRGVGLIDRPEVPLGTSLVAVGKGMHFGYLPIGGGRTYWFATANLPEGGYDPVGRTRAILLDVFANWYRPITAVIDATEQTAILRGDTIDRKPIRRWGDGRVTLLGDAAHPTTPFLGQGACMAIESGWVLADCLKAGADPVSGLREYERRRMARTAGITKKSWQMGRLLTLENPVLNWVRDRLFANIPGGGAGYTRRLVSVQV
jgi:FAD-dependent urate hydroxylase